MKHQFKEHRFDHNGFLNETYCCVQTYKCHCGKELSVAMGQQPIDDSECPNKPPARGKWKKNQ